MIGPLNGRGYRFATWSMCDGLREGAKEEKYKAGKYEGKICIKIITSICFY